MIEQPTAPYYLRVLTPSGVRLHGASDPNFKTINVLREG
jgi:hypothetical protein